MQLRGVVPIIKAHINNQFFTLVESNVNYWRSARVIDFTAYGAGGSDYTRELTY